MKRLYGIGKAAKSLGVSISTEFGQRSYDLAKSDRTIAYARVSSHDQKSDLARQKQVLALY